MIDNTSIKDLSKLAKEVLKLKAISAPKRPLVIEFCGTPKSGKTSSLNSMNIFLKRNGFKTKILHERGSICPITDKFNPLFNIWTSCSTIAELSSYLSPDPETQLKHYYDVILIDRGIFDALCWFHWQLHNDNLDQDNFSSLVKFLTMNKWKQVIDLIYVFQSSPEISLKREYANLLTKKFGSVMNPTVLSTFNESINESFKKYKKYYRKVVKIDTSELDQSIVGKEVTENTLKILEALLMEEIGYYDVKLLANHINNDQFKYTELKLTKNSLNFGLRKNIESSNKYIQPIPIVVFTNKEKNKFLVFKKTRRSAGKSSPERDRILLYAGGHIRKEEIVNSRWDLLRIAKATVQREINEELNFSYYPKTANPLIIWVKDYVQSKKHMAICFIAEKNLDELSIKLDNYEFIQTKGKSKSGRILTTYEILNMRDKLDSWSAIIFKYLTGKTIKSSQISISLDY